MGSGKNNAGIESPTSPHVSRRNLEMRSEAAMFYAVIKGDDLVMTRICLLEVISHSRKGGSRGGYISGSALKVYDDCQRRYLSGVTCLTNESGFRSVRNSTKDRVLRTSAR